MQSTALRPCAVWALILLALLARRLDWNERVTVPNNYEQLQLLYDPNAGFGRNSKADAVAQRGEQLLAAGEEPESDEGTP